MYRDFIKSFDIDAVECCRRRNFNLRYVEETAVVDPVDDFLFSTIKFASSSFNLRENLSFTGGVQYFLVVKRERDTGLQIGRLEAIDLYRFFNEWKKSAAGVDDDFYLIPSACGFMLYFSHHNEILVYTTISFL